LADKNIPPRYAAQLEDLRAWHVIFATCPACGKRTRISAQRLQIKGADRPTPGSSTSSESFAAMAAAIEKATR